MNLRIHLTVFAAFASAALFAQEKRPATVESTPVSRIETRNKNLDRGIHVSIFPFERHHNVCVLGCD